MRFAVARRPIPVGRAQTGRAVGRAGARAGGDEAQARRRHQAFLRSRNRDIDAPSVHRKRHAAQRGDGVDQIECVVAGRFDGGADRRDIVGDAGRGLDLHGEDRLDRAAVVGAQAGFDIGWPHRAPPIAGENFDLDAESRRSIAPSDAELAAFQDQNLVAARQHIGQRRFPGAMAVGDINVGTGCGSENFAEIAQHAIGQRDQRLGIDLDRRAVHRLQHFVGNIRRPRDRQEFTTRADGHGPAPHRSGCFASSLLSLVRHRIARATPLEGDLRAVRPPANHGTNAVQIPDTAPPTARA